VGPPRGKGGKGEGKLQSSGSNLSSKPGGFVQRKDWNKGGAERGGGKETNPGIPVTEVKWLRGGDVGIRRAGYKRPGVYQGWKS